MAGHPAACVQVEHAAERRRVKLRHLRHDGGGTGSFAAVVDGRQVDMAMSSYRASVDSTAFELPSGAGVPALRLGAT
jgi:hypothetical protein